MLERSPARLARAEALTDLGAALRRARRRADARPPLREALELRAAAAPRSSPVAPTTSCRRPARRCAATPIGVESLTPSERRVAEPPRAG